MRKPALIASLVATAGGLSAQCDAATLRRFATNDPFVADFFLGSPGGPAVPDPGFAICSDWTLSSSILVSQIECFLYDDGVNPDQVGNTAPVDVWLCPTTWLGSELTPPRIVGTVAATPVGTGPWILAGSGTCTVADSSSHSVIALAAPIRLDPGSYGVMIQVGRATAGPHPLDRLHPLLRLPIPNPVVADPPLTVSNQNHQRVVFTSGLGGPQGINIEVRYLLVPDVAAFVEYGAGCYRLPQSFYETFAAPGAVDLAPGGLRMLHQGAYYLVQSSPALYAAPTGGQLNIVGTAAASWSGLGSATEWDEAVTAPLALPASWGAGFPFPGGTTTQVAISSNGCVFLAPSLDTSGFYGDIPRFLGGQPRLAIAWGDQDCSAAGASLHYQIAPGDTHVDITWHDVPEYAPVPTGVPFRYQMRLFPSGQVEFLYSTPMTMAGAPVLVGFSRGNGAADPGNRDISGTLPFVSGDGSTPAHLTMVGRPVIGTTPNLRTEGIAAGATFNLMVLSFLPQVPALPLDALGMPGCLQHLGVPTASTFGRASPAAVHTALLSIPNHPLYNGAQLFVQAAQLVIPGPHSNAAGVLTSNGLCLRVGLQ